MKAFLDSLARWALCHVAGCEAFLSLSGSAYERGKGDVTMYCSLFLVGSSRTPAAFVKPCPSPCLVPCTHVVLSSTPSLHRAPVSPHPDSSSMYFYGRASFPFRDDTTPCVVEAFHSGAPAQTRQRVRQRVRVHPRKVLALATLFRFFPRGTATTRWPHPKNRRHHHPRLAGNHE